MLRTKAAAEEVVLRELPEVQLIFSFVWTNLFLVYHICKSSNFSLQIFPFKRESLGNESSHVEFSYGLVM